MSIQDEIIDWLRNAYVMERSMEVSLEKLSSNSHQSVHCRTAAASHLRETRKHAYLVETLLKSLGAHVSSFKTGIGVMSERIKSMGITLSHDEQIKDLVASYTMEHFEIGCYLSVATAAESAGLSEIADICREILLDEAGMAETLRKELPHAVQEYLGVTAIEKAA